MVPNYKESFVEKVDFEAKNPCFQPRDNVHCVQEQILHDMYQNTNKALEMIKEIAKCVCAYKEDYITLILPQHYSLSAVGG